MKLNVEEAKEFCEKTIYDQEANKWMGREKKIDAVDEQKKRQKKSREMKKWKNMSKQKERKKKRKADFFLLKSAAKVKSRL